MPNWAEYNNVLRKRADIRYGGMRPDRNWLQFGCALSYGLVEYLRTLDMLKKHGWVAQLPASKGDSTTTKYVLLIQPWRPQL